MVTTDPSPFELCNMAMRSAVIFNPTDLCLVADLLRISKAAFRPMPLPAILKKGDRYPGSLQYQVVPFRLSLPASKQCLCPSRYLSYQTILMLNNKVYILL